MRILQLLEDGKINAQEAARLLEALSQSETKEKRRRLWSSIEVIPDVVSSAIASSFKYATSKETLQFPKKKKIEFKGISGDLEITGNATENIEIQKDGFAKIKEGEHHLEIKAISGEMKITTPKNTNFEMKGVSGDLKISHLNGKIEIASVSGDIQGKELSGSFNGDFVSGDIDLDYKDIEEIKIKSKTGDIVLRLEENIEAEIEVETINGDIDCDFALKDEERKENLLRGIINKPGVKIELKNEHGDIAIKKRKSG